MYILKYCSLPSDWSTGTIVIATETWPHESHAGQHLKQRILITLRWKQLQRHHQLCQPNKGRTSLPGGGGGGESCCITPKFAHFPHSRMPPKAGEKELLTLQGDACQQVQDGQQLPKVGRYTPRLWTDPRCCRGVKLTSQKKYWDLNIRIIHIWR